MLHYVMRTTPGWQDKAVGRPEEEPIALVKVNAKERGNMSIGTPRPSRFGSMAPVNRNGQHVYNLLIGDNEDVEIALIGIGSYRLEEVTQAEWETWAELELFPVLKLGMAR